MTSLCIVYLASPKGFHIYDDPSQESRLVLLQQSVHLTRSLFPTTPIFVFHEDYGQLEKEELPEVTEFIQVDFSGKEDIVNKSLRRPYGYLMMCRFFSGVMQSHTRIQEFTHYLRLDDDSYFLKPFLHENYVKNNFLKYDYVYRSAFGDLEGQQSLFDFTLEFLRKEGYGAHIPVLMKELEKKYVVKNGQYTGLAPYNNFHIASRRLWENPLIQRYIQAIEESNGILQRGWMDANIHAMIIYVLTLFIGMKIHHDASFGYRHNRHISRIGSTSVDYDEKQPFGLKKVHYRLPKIFKGGAYRLADAWTEFIPVTKGPIRYTEVGAFYGANLASVAQIYGTHPESRFIAIDPWTDYSEYPEYKGQQETTYDSFMRNMENLQLLDKVEVMRGFSHKMLPLLEDESYDIIYIDGNHNPEYVLEDAVLAFRKLKVKGWLVFDDYGWGGPDLTKRGIDCFLFAYRDRLGSSVERDSQVFVQRIN